MSRLRPAADRLARGAARIGPALARRMVAWVRRGHRDDLAGLAAHLGTIARAALIALGIYLLARAVRASPALMWALAGVGLAAAWRAGRPAPVERGEEEASETPVEGAEEAAEEGVEAVPVEAPLPTREELAQALRAVADPNVHTAALATHLGLPAERVRAALKAAGIPAGGQVRMGGVTSTGIKAAHFPPLSPSGEGAPGPVVVAGQASNNSNSNAVRVKRGEGTVTIYDPSDSHRHHRVA
ncbi:hypothetical protein ACFUAH_16930 [Streptomyces albidoflavus]|uniref:hypothetical protein n=1 Tax=Streptomyces albidoflavus TaxID=1886 RepID=UPI000775BE1E|nr:hypothetical protein [Streptomyces albidoflavus]AMM12349.1 hypothetical protein Salbus254_5921 [Streptomyces albidoflavus]